MRDGHNDYLILTREYLKGYKRLTEMRKGWIAEMGDAERELASVPVAISGTAMSLAVAQEIPHRRNASPLVVWHSESGTGCGKKMSRRSRGSTRSYAVRSRRLVMRTRVSSSRTTSTARPGTTSATSSDTRIRASVKKAAALSAPSHSTSSASKLPARSRSSSSPSLWITQGAARVTKSINLHAPDVLL